MDIDRLMRKYRVPKGSDDPEAQALGAPPLHHIEPNDELTGWNLGQDDPHDHYPWTWSPYLDGDGNPDEHGSICTPNGWRPDGRMHTYWMIATTWEPHGRLICRLVNQWAHEQFGTPVPEEE